MRKWDVGWFSPRNSEWQCVYLWWYWLANVTPFLLTPIRMCESSTAQLITGLSARTMIHTCATRLSLFWNGGGDRWKIFIVGKLHGTRVLWTLTEDLCCGFWKPMEMGHSVIHLSCDAKDMWNCFNNNCNISTKFNNISTYSKSPTTCWKNDKSSQWLSTTFCYRYSGVDILSLRYISTTTTTTSATTIHYQQGETLQQQQRQQQPFIINKVCNNHSSSTMGNVTTTTTIVSATTVIISNGRRYLSLW